MFKLKLCISTLILSVAVLVSGCASIVSKSSYPVAITSSPDQAEFIITDKSGAKVYSGVTPTTVTLKSGCGFFKSEEYKVTFKKDGFDPQTTTISSTMDGWYLGNILIGGLIGILIVDPATGAMWKLPETVASTLHEHKSANNEAGKKLKVLSYNSIPEKYREHLVLMN